MNVTNELFVLERLEIDREKFIEKIGVHWKMFLHSYIHHGSFRINNKTGKIQLYY